MRKQNDNTYGNRQGDQALQPLWSASEVNHLGKATCYIHSSTNQPAADYVLFHDGDNKNPRLRFFTSFGVCMFCGKGAGQ